MTLDFYALSKNRTHHMQNESHSPVTGPIDIEKYNAYLRYEKEYNDLADEYLTAYASAQNNPAELDKWAAIGGKYMDDMNEALQRWEELGFKPEIDELLKSVDAELDFGPIGEQDAQE